MNAQKVSFIICTDSESALHECEIYIKQLTVPEEFVVNVLPIRGANSMAEGYNAGMLQTDAKYKVYLHQDALILNKNFLQDTLAIFQENPQIGMIGMVGTKQLHKNGCIWTNPMRTGALRSHLLTTSDDYFDVPIPSNRSFAIVEAIDGLLMMTQQDFLWRSDLFTGWDFYDLSQCQEFARAGYRIAVPHQETPWVLHDSGAQNLKDYHAYRKTYLEEYYPDNQVEIDACKRFIATQTTDGSTNTAVSRDNAVSTLISMIDFRDYEEALHFTQENLSQNQDNELFCILTVFLQIYQQETEAGLHEVFLPLENGSQTAGWLPLHYQRICRYIWRIENGLPQEYLDEAHQYFKRWHVSRTAQDRIRILCLPE